MTTAEEEAALVAAIVLEPEDDTVRLVYCDWLEEHDRHRRSTMIRRMLKRPRASIGMAYPWRPTRGGGFSCRSMVPANAYRPGAADEGIQFPNLGSLSRAQFEPCEHFTSAVLRRGFVDEVACSWETWTTASMTQKAYWSLRQTNWCLSCSAERRHDCERCCGTGKVPRPCPVTAQPIQRVRLEYRPRWRRELRVGSVDDWAVMLMGLAPGDLETHPLGEIMKKVVPYRKDEEADDAILRVLLALHYPGVEFFYPPHRR